MSISGVAQIYLKRDQQELKDLRKALKRAEKQIENATLVKAHTERRIAELEPDVLTLEDLLARLFDKKLRVGGEDAADLYEKIKEYTKSRPLESQGAF